MFYFDIFFTDRCLNKFAEQQQKATDVNLFATTVMSAYVTQIKRVWLRHVLRKDGKVWVKMHRFSG